MRHVLQFCKDCMMLYYEDSMVIGHYSFVLQNRSFEMLVTLTVPHLRLFPDYTHWLALCLDSFYF